MDANVELLRADDVAAELSDALRRYLRRYTGDDALAEDLLQETLIRVTHGLAALREHGRVKTWAFTIATRVAAEHFRKTASRSPVVEMEESLALEDPAPGVDERLVVDEMNGCVRRTIDTLPADYRAALVLHDLEGLSAAQAAEVCACSLATMKMRIHRARARLRQALQAECELYRDGDNVLRCDRKE